MTKKVSLKEINKLMSGKNLNGIVKSVCGELIGRGLYRDVYVLKQNPKYVVKIERDPTTATFANVTEWRNYINNKGWDFLAEWLAPCEMINETGQVMIQRRVEHRKRKDYPTHVPIFFTDLKLTNFGWIGEQFVCCDYSFLILAAVAKGKNKMKYAKWWNVNPKKND